MQIGIKQKRGAAIKEIEDTVLSALTVEGVRKEQAALAAAAQAKVPEEVLPGTWEDEEVLVEDGLVDESEVHVTPVPRKPVVEVCQGLTLLMVGNYIHQFCSATSRMKDGPSNLIWSGDLNFYRSGLQVAFCCSNL